MERCTVKAALKHARRVFALGPPKSDHSVALRVESGVAVPSLLRPDGGTGETMRL